VTMVASVAIKDARAVVRDVVEAAAERLKLAGLLEVLVDDEHGWRPTAFVDTLNYAARATSLSIPSSYSTGVR
jgi:D-aminopeptidase